MAATSSSVASSSASLDWLHLSDFHFRTATGWSQDVVLSTMLTDIVARYGGNNHPDLVFLTGDIVYSGKEEEYRLAEDFLHRLSSAIKLPIERFCIVPGNHDIDLDCEEDAVAGARHRLTSPTEVDLFFGNEGRRKTLFARQAAFRDFSNRVLAPVAPIYTPTSYTHVRTLQVGALRVRVLLLDSTWLAGGDRSDPGTLLVGERQVLDCGEPTDESLTFALLHHPFAWLRDFEAVSVENLVARSAQICLRGHAHAPDFRATDGPQGRLITFTAGAAFQTRTTDNSYLWCSLDLTTGVGKKIVHRYRHAEHSWEAGAREPWVFLPEAPPPSDFAFIRKTLLDASTRYASYVTCLVSNLQTEVPFLLPDRRLTFVACNARLPASENRCGDLILRIRNHFHWKRVWEKTAWEAQLIALAGELGGLFEEAETIEHNALHSRDEISASLLLAFSDPSGVSSAVCDEIRHLLRDGDLERARVVLMRWQRQDILRSDEARELSRLEIVLLLAEKKPIDANGRAILLVSSPDRTADDVALAARCAFDAKDYPRAASLMHEALDLGAAVDWVRSVALAIAGVAGDRKLAERVL